MPLIPQVGRETRKIRLLLISINIILWLGFIPSLVDVYYFIENK